ncbi:MAG TPA: serine/threonine-protein kinase, partial [Isosphaeraceae bacterium]|nr:serine/threonine-protein kinase [Isosphaeraceae bacterium]
MNIDHVRDEELVRRLPLPLAQLYARACNKTGDARLNTASCLWEAALKLLGSVAIVNYADRGQHSPELSEQLKSLSRPPLGEWWKYVRILLPVLADAGDEGFRAVRELVLGRSRDNLPRLAGLDSELINHFDVTESARSTVRLSELFNRLVQFRNEEIGHGALGQRPADFYERMGTAMLAGLAELLGALDVLAGRKLLYVHDLRRLPTGVWAAECYELLGESPRRVGSLELPAAEAARLLPQRVYLDTGPRKVAVDADTEAGAAAPPSRLHSLHPLVFFNLEENKFFFLNSRKKKEKTEYLCYTSGDHDDRPDLGQEQRELLVRVLGIPVKEEDVKVWQDKTRAGESGEPAPQSADAPRKLGEFELLSQLGSGGMGVVYRAWQPTLGRQVALKCLPSAGPGKVDHAEVRFRREIKALGKVRHPNLVEIFTSGSVGHQWFYVMELVEGTTLSDVCQTLHDRGSTAAGLNLTTWKDSLSTACERTRKSEKPLAATDHDEPPDGLPPLSAEPRSRTSQPRLQPGQSYAWHMAELLRQVADAAHALHEVGVVHRDIKPANIMLSADGTKAMLMDLGVAQLDDDAKERLTRSGHLVGTLRYASPEQILSRTPVDRRSDVYSLGVTLWELLTLRPLFDATPGTPDYELETKILMRDPPAVRSVNREIPRDLEAIVSKCMEKEPDKRYATAGELAEDLGRFLAGEPVKARPIGRLGRTARWARRRPAAAAMLSVGALLFLSTALSAFVYWNKNIHVTVAYYNKQANAFGIPHGIGRLSASQVRHRSASLKFYYRAGRVQRVDVVDGQDRPTATKALKMYFDNDSSSSNPWLRDCRYDYQYNEKGELAKEVGRNRFGDIVYTFVYTNR